MSTVRKLIAFLGSSSGPRRDRGQVLEDEIEFATRENSVAVVNNLKAVSKLVKDTLDLLEGKTEEPNDVEQNR